MLSYDCDHLLCSTRLASKLLILPSFYWQALHFSVYPQFLWVQLVSIFIPLVLTWAGQLSFSTPIHPNLPCRSLQTAATSNYWWGLFLDIPHLTHGGFTLSKKSIHTHWRLVTDCQWCEHVLSHTNIGPLNKNTGHNHNIYDWLTCFPDVKQSQTGFVKPGKCFIFFFNSLLKTTPNSSS